VKKQLLALSSSPAFTFVLTMGVVNLFGDMTYEGGASINGPFLGTLGASAAAISIIAGVGEFLGYSLRSLSGDVADKTGKHWPVTFVGYAINLLAVPAMPVPERLLPNRLHRVADLLAAGAGGAHGRPSCVSGALTIGAEGSSDRTRERIHAGVIIVCRTGVLAPLAMRTKVARL
jgi:hypothetical protein